VIAGTPVHSTIPEANVVAPGDKIHLDPKAAQQQKNQLDTTAAKAGIPEPGRDIFEGGEQVHNEPRSSAPGAPVAAKADEDTRSAEESKAATDASAEDGKSHDDSHVGPDLPPDPAPDPVAQAAGPEPPKEPEDPVDPDHDAPVV
jgi:dolichyl-phosphate-mannose-protein mannosyltransferase